MASPNPTLILGHDRFTWDLWYTELEDGLFRIYFLNTDAADMAEQWNDSNARIGTALTRDFQHFWDIEPDCFMGSNEPGAWDSGAIWSGCVRQINDGFLLFYTAIDSEDPGAKKQRIGIAFSEDGVHWERIDNTVIEPDRQWYHANNIINDSSINAWRDPFVFTHNGHPYMLVAAKSRNLDPGDLEGEIPGTNGVIAVLRAKNPDSLLEWEATPLCFSTGKTETELPQIHWDHTTNMPLITYSAWDEDEYFDRPFKERGGLYGFHYDLGKELEYIEEILAQTGEFPKYYPVKVRPHPLVKWNDTLYGFSVIPELANADTGKAMGFQVKDGGIGLSDVPQLKAVTHMFDSLDRISMQSMQAALHTGAVTDRQIQPPDLSTGL